MTDERRASLLAYCRLEEFAEDAAVLSLLDGFYLAAVGYLEGAGVSEPAAGTPRAAQYDLCVNVLVLDAYDHRDLKEPSSQVTENIAFRRMLNQLKLTEGMENVFDSNTSDEEVTGT